MKRHSFKGGVVPLRWFYRSGKQLTCGKAVREFISDTVCIQLDAHLGDPSEPCVKKGDHVRVGQVIAEAVGPRGVPVHASISGQVTDIGMVQQLRRTPSPCITIQNDFADEWVPIQGLGEDVEAVPVDEIIPAIRRAGIIGMGGAAFPTHYKLTIPPDKSVDTVIINGAECETFLTSDHRLMLESPSRIVDGLRLVMRALGVDKGIIGIEDNKMDAVKAMCEHVERHEGLEVMLLDWCYPQGGEKQLIQAATGREVPSGGLPVDINVVVINVGTAAAIADAVLQGRPLINRITTVSGKVENPGNLLLRNGTIFSDTIVGCGGYTEEPGKILAGGTMTGIAAPQEHVSITLATNGILVLGEKEAKSPPQRPCMRCSRCIRPCPAGLKPYRLNELYGLRDWDGMVREHLHDCIQCGACSYVCPARRWLSASFQIGKEQVARRAKR